jgi:vacuolar-type H+-ATPase subunit B/Vma2
MNLTDDPGVEWMVALTTVEYLAFEDDYHLLVTDTVNVLYSSPLDSYSRAAYITHEGFGRRLRPERKG